MARQFTENELIIASHNPGKISEISNLLESLGVDIRSAVDLSLPEPDETGNTFAANASLKAATATGATGLPALADDSGLAIDALDGKPGIYSARWAGPDKNFDRAIQMVESLLQSSDITKAQFICVLAIAWPDRHIETFEGVVHGNVVSPPRGKLGFGYDPIFLPSGYQETFGEMVAEEKHRISHRGKAFQKLLATCFY